MLVLGKYNAYKTFVLIGTKILWYMLTQDKDDDLKVGVKSTALRFGDSTKEWIAGFGIACTSSLALCGYNADIGIYPFLHLYSAQLGHDTL